MLLVRAEGRDQSFNWLVCKTAGFHLRPWHAVFQLLPLALLVGPAGSVAEALRVIARPRRWNASCILSHNCGSPVRVKEPTRLHITIRSLICRLLLTFWCNGYRHCLGLLGRCCRRCRHVCKLLLASCSWCCWHRDFSCWCPWCFRHWWQWKGHNCQGLIIDCLRWTSGI